MATARGRLAATAALSLAAAAVMLARAAWAFGRSPLVDAANLVPPALAFCLSAWLVRTRRAASTAVLLAAAGAGGAGVLIYWLGDSLSSVTAWAVQWLTALAAFVGAATARLAGDPAGDVSPEGKTVPRAPRLRAALLGFAAGAALGLALGLTVFRFEFRGSDAGGTTTTVSLAGAELFSVSGVFADLVRGAVLVGVCAALGLAGAAAAARLGRR